MRIFVAGGTGVIGRPIVRTLVRRGHEVTASTSRPSGLQVVEDLGARPVVMDGLDESAVRRVIVGAKPDVVINEMTALAVSSSDYGTWLAVTNQLRDEGTKAVMTAAQEAGARRVISQSGAYMVQPGSARRTSPRRRTWTVRGGSASMFAPASPVKRKCWAHQGSRGSCFATASSTVKAPRSVRMEIG